MKIKLVKSITGFFLFACALGSLVAAMALGTSGTAQADSPAVNCSANTLRGSYLFATHGYNIVGGVAQPKAIIEGIDFNGDGTLVTPFATVSNNGTILRFGAGPGTYTVNPDCTGTLTFTGVPTFDYDIFVEPTGRQLWMIQTGGPVPAVFEGIATRLTGRPAPPRPAL
jgi:hypothetical protein